MVADAVATLQPLADAKRLRVTLVPAASDGAIESTTILADVVRFKQIVYNLLSNAIKFSRAVRDGHSPGIDRRPISGSSARP